MDGNSENSHFVGQVPLTKMEMNSNVCSLNKNENDKSINLDLIQKQFIWLQMQEYKKETINKQELIEELKQRIDNEQLNFKDLFAIFSTLICNLLMEFGVYTVKDNNSVIDEISYENIYASDLKDSKSKLNKIKTFTINEAMTVLSLLRKFITQQQTFIDRIKNKKENTIETKEILEYFESQTIEFDKLQSQTNLRKNNTVVNKRLREQITEISTQSNIQCQILEQNKEEIEKLRNELKKNERIINKYNILNYQCIKKEQIPFDYIEKNTNTKKQKEMMDELNKQLEEIKELKKENMELKIRFASIPEYTIKNSIKYKDLEAELVLVKNRSRDIHNSLEKHKKLYNETLEQLTEMKALYEDFKTKSIDEMNLTNNKIQDDIVRIRQNRDQLQIALNMQHRPHKNNTDEIQIQRKINKIQRTRIQFLLLEINRHKIANKHKTDDKENCMAEMIQSVDNNIRDIGYELETLKLVMTSSYRDFDMESYSHSNIMRHPNSNNKCDFKHNGNESKKQKTHNNNDNTEMLKKELNQLKENNELLLKTESQLLVQLEKMGVSYQDLEEQLFAKDGIIDQLNMELDIITTEKAKVDQKYLANTRQIYQLESLNKINKEIIIQQLEHINNLNIRVQNLAHQTELLTTLNTNLNESLVNLNHKTTEQTNTIRVVNMQLLEANKKYNNINAKMHELTERYNKELETNKKLHQARFLDHNEQNGNHNHISESNSKEKINTTLSLVCDLEQQIKDYKKLLKCPSCDLRFKSHALLRCMHVFCKQCLTSRVGTRQRKCPTCNESFGINDIKQIYL